MLSTFAPEALFERLSGDFGQIRNADKMNAPCPTTSVHFGRLANVDEVCGVFAALGLAHDDARKGSSAQGPAPRAS